MFTKDDIGLYNGADKCSDEAICGHRLKKHCSNWKYYYEKRIGRS